MKKKLSTAEALKQGFIPIEALEKIEDFGLFILNQEEKIIGFSKGCEKIDGYSRDMVLGKHPRAIYNIIYPKLSDERDDAAMSLSTLRKGRTYIDVYDCYQTANKKEIDISNSGYPIKNEKDEVVGSLTLYWEVSKYLKTVSILNQKNSDAKKLNKNGTSLQYDFDDVIGASIVLKKCLSQGQIAAETTAPVLIFGETGTGKEVFAQSIHTAGSRGKKSFVAINCSAIPANLLESTLFGTVKSAFTGAADTAGLFAEAEGGTLFLDEVNSMDISLQSKLLRFLETGCYRKLGSTQEIKSDVRIISALNQDPFEAIEENRLRNDLYYRLAIFVIHLPPLRERGEDLLLLSEYFIASLSGVLGKKITHLAKDTYEIFRRCPWPGNIRELKHVITQSLYMAKAEECLLKPHFLPQYILDLVKVAPQTTIANDFNEDMGLKARLDLVEKQIIQKALEKNKNNISKTARELQVSRENLRNKIKKFSVE